MKSYLRTGLIASLLCLIYALAVIKAYDDPLALVTLGEQFAPQELQVHTYSAEGYDGQFAYYFARYGMDAAEFIDLPSYRGQRILLSFLGGLLAFGQVALLPYTLLLVNLIALGISTYLLEELLAQYRVSRWFAIGYALSLGVWGAARLNTTETLAYGLVIGGIFAMQRDRWRLASIIFALAALSKEMTLVFPAAYGLHMLYQRDWRRGLTFGTIVLLPFSLWQGILYSTYGQFGIGSGGGGATSFELIPFGGVFRIITEADGGALVAFLLLVGVFVLVPTFWAFWRCWRDLRYSLGQNKNIESTIQGWKLSTTLLFVNVMIMPFVPFSTYREPLGILRFIVGLQIAIILYAAERRQRRVLLYSTLWLVTSLLVIVSDFAR